MVRALETPTSLTVSPALVELTLTPNQPSRTSLTIINGSAIPLPIRASAQSYGDSLDSATWIKVEPADFILQPAAQKTVLVHILPPANASPGGHYATLIFEPLIPENLAATPQALARVGTIMLFSLPGEIKTQLSVSPPQFSSLLTALPKDFQLELSNTGNTHFLPTFELELKNSMGQTISPLTVTSSLLLPGEKKLYSFRWQSVQYPGRYTISGHVSFGTPTKELQLPISTIWFIPIWQIILYLLLTLLFFWSILRYKRIIFALQILKTGKISHENTTASKNS